MSSVERRDLDEARRAVALACRRGASFAEARVTRGGSVGLSVQDGRAERMGAAQVSGSCVRLILNGRWGFASSDGAGRRHLTDAAGHALALARSGHALGRPAEAAKRRTGGQIRISGGEQAGTVLAGPAGLSAWASKVLKLERAARRFAGRRGVNSLASFGQQAGCNVVAASDGTAVVRWGRRQTCSLTVVVSERRRGIQRWTERAGSTGNDDLLAGLEPERFSRDAAGRALAVLAARPAPGGEWPVIFDPETGGVFVHECLGHNAEADLVLSGQSLLAGKLGWRLAGAHVTVVDDPTLPGAFGSYEFDSEGTPAERVEIIGRGVLKSYLHSLETASRMRTRPNGHGRAEGVGAPPLVRMSNTFFAPGESRLDDMLAGIDRGLLLEHGAGGHVLSEKGHYTVMAGCGRLIRDGRLGPLVRDVSISGLVLESLRDIDAVSSDFALGSPGYCGKDGQEVPVDDGGAYVRLAKVVVGGRGGWPRGGG
jgi:TldD protein